MNYFKRNILFFFVLSFILGACEVVGYTELIIINNSSYNLFIRVWDERSRYEFDKIEVSFQEPDASYEVVINRNEKYSIGGSKGDHRWPHIPWGLEPEVYMHGLFIFDNDSKNLLISAKTRIEIHDLGYKFITRKEIGWRRNLTFYELEITDDMIEPVAKVGYFCTASYKMNILHRQAFSTISN